MYCSWLYVLLFSALRDGSLGTLYELSRIPWFNALLQNCRTARSTDAGAACGNPVRGTSLIVTHSCTDYFINSCAFLKTECALYKSEMHKIVTEAFSVFPPFVLGVSSLSGIVCPSPSFRIVPFLRAFLYFSASLFPPSWRFCYDVMYRLTRHLLSALLFLYNSRLYNVAFDIPLRCSTLKSTSE